MRRTKPSPSHRRDAIRSTRQRVAVLLGLLALGLLAGHVHPPYVSESGPLDVPVVSDDHAHHEHSAHVAVDNAPCIGCRSFDDEATLTSDGGCVVPADLVVLTLPDLIDGAARAPFAGLPATRAPPIV